MVRGHPGREKSAGEQGFPELCSLLMIHEVLPSPSAEGSAVLLNHHQFNGINPVPELQKVVALPHLRPQLPPGQLRGCSELSSPMGWVCSVFWQLGGCSGLFSPMGWVCSVFWQLRGCSGLFSPMGWVCPVPWQLRGCRVRCSGCCPA